MRSLLTFLTMPFTTITFATLIPDFYIALALVIFSSFGSYMFFDKHFDAVKK